MASCKVGLYKAAYQAVELPGNICGSLQVRAELITQQRLLTAELHNRWGSENVYSRSHGRILVKEVSESLKNQLASDEAKFL